MIGLFAPVRSRQSGRPARKARTSAPQFRESSDEDGSSDGGGDSDDSGDFLAGGRGRRSSLRGGADRDRHQHPQRMSARAAAARVSYAEEEDEDA